MFSLIFHCGIVQIVLKRGYAEILLLSGGNINIIESRNPLNIADNTAMKN
jgi:hypothetical protein